MAFSGKSAAVLAGAVCGAYLVTRKNHLKVYHYDIVNSRIPEEFDGYRILHLSDLHGRSYGKDGIYLTEICKELNPDIIVFTGDLYSRDANIFTMRKKLPLMKALNGIAPVYYVWGNHEADIPEKAVLMNGRLEEEGITVLRNEKMRIYSGESFINLYGLELDASYYRDDDKKGFERFRELPELTEQNMYSLLGAAEADKFNILLAHNPLPFDVYARWGADFVMSGHVHGGIVRIGETGLLSPERKFLPKYTKGLYLRETDSGKSLMEVSAGLGKFRINNPETASVCVLRTKSR